MEVTPTPGSLCLLPPIEQLRSQPDSQLEGPARSFSRSCSLESERWTGLMMEIRRRSCPAARSGRGRWYECACIERGLEREEGHRPLLLVWLPPVLAAGVGLEKIDQEEGSLTWGQG